MHLLFVLTEVFYLHINPVLLCFASADINLQPLPPLRLNTHGYNNYDETGTESCSLCVVKDIASSSTLLLLVVYSQSLNLFH